MKEQSETRAVILGEYIVRQKATVRAAAEWFGVSKSTVHKDVSERLEQIQPDLYTQVKRFWNRTNRNVIFVAVSPPNENMPCAASRKRNFCISKTHDKNTLSPFGETGYFS
ncbi:MAG: sporulation transcriptional regulator SpoIIID [Ruminococcus callidus]